MRGVAAFDADDFDRQVALQRSRREGGRDGEVGCFAARARAEEFAVENIVPKYEECYRKAMEAVNVAV